ncbi:MAG: adenosylcobinamide-GDP ribazoletransferase [Salinarimonadaceae bacterium]|nr:MAG: adenosylcobinamide-GDP ribazoletransferase [Salinarimonadaceae bacterium]
MDRQEHGAPQDEPAYAPASAVVRVAQCLRFYSRLSVPALSGERDPHARPDFAAMTDMIPVAGAIIGAIGALVFLAAHTLGLGPLIAATLAVTALVFATGAFHEDGLADTFDSFGGGATREKRLAIMKDSSIGVFGAAALVLGLGLRVLLLAEIARRISPLAAAGALVGVAALSRSVALAPLIFLEPARSDGASAAVGRPTRANFAIACAIAAAIYAFFGLATGLPASGLALGAMLAVAVTALMIGWSKAMIDGQTGDVIGSSQQIAEITIMLGLLILAAG